MPLHDFGRGLCIYVASGDISYLRLNRPYIFDCSVRTERLSEDSRLLASPPYRRGVRGISALDPPAPEDEDNIMAALKQSDRVSSISLTVTTSLLDKLYAIERPFSELEDLVLLSRDSVQLTLPSTFRWGPRLRRLHLTRIAFPALLQLLHSSRNLVDLQLHEVLNPWYFSPEALTNALSGMAQLQSLSLHFSLYHQSRFPYPHRPGNALFSLLSPALIFEELPSTWNALYSESMLLVSGISKSHSSMNPPSIFQDLANSSIG